MLLALYLVKYMKVMKVLPQSTRVTVRKPNLIKVRGVGSQDVEMGTQHSTAGTKGLKLRAKAISNRALESRPQ